MSKFVCSVCGYVYEGNEAPDECPVCKAKKEMFKNKFLSWFWRGMGLISLDRQKTDFTALKTSLSVLKDGKKLVIFPEGTRNKVNTELQEIKGGTALFAIKAKVPIVPMWIEKRGKIFRRN